MIQPGGSPAMPIHISAEVQIAAPPERVWAVLADLSSYRQWHPVFVSVNGELAAGSKLTITTTHPTTGRTMNAKVTVQTVEPDTELRWASKMAGLPISDRRFLLSPSSGGTLLVQAGTYRGLGGSRGRSRSTAKSIGRIQDAYAAINQAIKQQAESRPD
jgi:hypothetical protein